MIGCRYIYRADCIWKISHAVYLLPKPIDYFQGYVHCPNLSLNRRMGGSKHALNATDHSKKRRMEKSFWRPVSTRSNSGEGCSEKDAKTFQVIDCNDKSDDGFQFKVEHLNTSSCNVDILNSTADTGPITEQAELLTLTSVAVQSNDQSEALEEASAISGNMVDNLSQSQRNVSELKSFESIYKEEFREVGVRELDIAVRKDNDAEKYSTSIEVDASLVRFIKGKGGSKQKEFETETGVRIIFPSWKGKGAIVIEGTSIENVTKASDKIKVVLEEAIKSPQLDYSHFISLPLAIHPELVEKLIDFQNSILGNPEPSQDVNLDSDSSEDSSDDREDKNIKNNQLDEGLTFSVNLKVQKDDEHVKVEIDDAVGKNVAIKTRSSILSDTPANLGIDRSIFTKPKTFHLTVLMLKLWNKERLAAATEVLQSVSSKVKDALEGRPVFVRLKGLECMKGSPAKARVLYASVEEVGGEDRLLRACETIIEAYVDAGLILERDAQHRLKLHATLMNARHRKRKKRTRRYDSFDARDIYKQYGSVEWGEYLIHEAHLSQRFAFDDNGYYHCCTSVPFPQSMQTE
ncbi:activating signal cointegrator 1 complex subunit 1 isoform X2 [Cinnamomum micranthum f. kanehirae]|uniref:Activating signal cointegrator 1 complex subunit 1 isoform X2 n=1 Tax=Cinnamomum micranthum f. kanehirae TaxID=337451 RepID=A0A443NH62_9MAGN|nr:activating signal cointegrator 1 complex subunit 1 isoform X2 [Cinnamomum micranthum f. kanehirae]